MNEKTFLQNFLEDFHNLKYMKQQNYLLLHANYKVKYKLLHENQQILTKKEKKQEDKVEVTTFVILLHRNSSLVLSYFIGSQLFRTTPLSCA